MRGQNTEFALSGGISLSDTLYCPSRYAVYSEEQIYLHRDRVRPLNLSVRAALGEMQGFMNQVPGEKKKKYALHIPLEPHLPKFMHMLHCDSNWIPRPKGQMDWELQNSLGLEAKACLFSIIDFFQ